MSLVAQTFQQIWQLLGHSDRVLIASHRDPDGDAVAAVLALQHILAAHGVAATAYLPDPAPLMFAFLPGFATLTTRPPADISGLVVGLDYGDWARLGLPDTIPNERIITIDHHPRRGQRGILMAIDETASSTCEILYRFCGAAGIGLDRTLAITLLTGIVTDTGSFQHANTSPATLEAVEDLMLKGAPLPKVLKRIAAQRSPALLHAWGAALKRVRVDDALGLVYMLMPHDALIAAGLDSDDLSSGFASLLSTIPNTRCAAFLVEQTPGVVRGSLRSDGSLAISVARVAQALGGGGHERAAGFTVNGTVDTVWPKVKLEIQRGMGDTTV